MCDRAHDLHGSFVSERGDILWEVFRFASVPVDHDVPTQYSQFPTARRLKLYGKVAHRVTEYTCQKQTLIVGLNTRCLNKQRPWCRYERQSDRDTIGAVLVPGGSNRMASGP